MESFVKTMKDFDLIIVDCPNFVIDINSLITKLKHNDNINKDISIRVITQDSLSAQHRNLLPGSIQFIAYICRTDLSKYSTGFTRVCNQNTTGVCLFNKNLNNDLYEKENYITEELIIKNIEDCINFTKTILNPNIK